MADMNVPHGTLDEHRPDPDAPCVGCRLNVVAHVLERYSDDARASGAATIADELLALSLYVAEIVDECCAADEATAWLRRQLSTLHVPEPPATA
jgi:hypothetical protein